MPRVSHFIRHKTAANIHHAVRIAEAQDLPLNTFVTVNFSRTACAPEEVSTTFAHLRNTRYSHWARRPTQRSGAAPYQPTHVWVIEAGGGVIAAHWLLHVPPSRRLVFEKKMSRWIEAVAGAAFKNAVHVKNAHTPRGAGRYMLKGMDQAWAKFYGIDFSDQGEVHGRRCGYSLNLGPSMKKKLRAEGRYQAARSWRRFPSSPPPEARPS
ncbi:hypothetical protein FV228_00225 [Methylobacterium sp. WL18]|uniref:hypothetical protein n=1 Tax=Methylobacterium sp. WL18 TaxID=2603897 RepID=UPI0011C80D65|nr:hypothetical protein [Methylobacterium sp. WL18]TXN76614.1 hypothetical protein FV228_00225 [Methylobacterium sp. WL18]